MADIIFDYFTAAEAGQYTFYRIPKALFTEAHFQALSCEAKLLYGMMLDRMGLSIRNQWFDSLGRAYIIFTVEDVMGVMGCQSQKAVRLMKELDTADGIGLIEKKRVGLGKPNLIYVKNFMTRGNTGTGAQAGHSGSSGRKETGFPSGTDVPKGKGTVPAGVDKYEASYVESTGYVPADGGCMGSPASGCTAGTKNCAIHENNWWMGGEAMPADADSLGGDGGIPEENWWDVAVDAECGGKAQGVSGELRRCMGPGAVEPAAFLNDYKNVDAVESVDNVDKCRQAAAEKQNSDYDTYFEPSSSAAGQVYGKYRCFQPECRVNMPETSLSGAVGGMAGDAAAGRGKFADETVEAMVREFLWHEEKTPEHTSPEKGPQTGAGQEIPEPKHMDFEKQVPVIVDAKAPEQWDAKCNDTEYSNTEYNDTDNSGKENNKTDFCASYQSYQSYQPHQSGQSGRQDTDTDCDGNGRTDSVMGKMDAYREAIRENIDYPCFEPQDTEDVDELVELMVDAMMVPDSQGIRIAGTEKPASVVKSRFMKLAHSHVQYVMGCLQKHTGKIWNIKAYLMTALYNSSLTISSYYRAEVNHDLYGCC